jgi:hypothetical protein
MASEQLGPYEIAYSGVRLGDVEGWAAWLEIFGPSHNPMHRNAIFPAQRVAVQTLFASQREAEQEARRIAHDMVARGASRSGVAAG